MAIIVLDDSHHLARGLHGNALLLQRLQSHHAHLLNLIAVYALYQRRVLQVHAKPAVAQLVEWCRAGGGLGRSDKDKDKDKNKEDNPLPPPHTGEITTVLGKKVYKEGKRVHMRMLCA